MYLMLLLAVPSSLATHVKKAIPQYQHLKVDIPEYPGPVRSVTHYPGVDALWDLRFWFDSGSQPPDPYQIGVEYAGDQFYVTAASIYAGAPNNTVYIYDTNGVMVDSFAQWCTPGGWGWRDLAYDGTYLYGADDNTVDAFNLDGNPVPAANIVLSAYPPGGSFPRALAYDPVSDHFWTGNFDNTMYEFDRSGNIIWSGSPSPLTTIYGMAWDDGDPLGGPWLWIHNQSPDPGGPNGCTIYQFDPVAHSFTGVSYNLPPVGGFSSQVAGGLTFTDEHIPYFYTLIGLAQGIPADFVFELEMYPKTHPCSPGEPTPAAMTNNGAALVASLAWTNPTLTAGGDTLTSIDSVLIFRNGSFLTSISSMVDTGVGLPMTYNDTSIPVAGIYNYQIQCTNDSGRGLPAAVGGWIGLDTPGPVTDLTGSGIGITLEATLSWVNPTAGAHGGYFPTGSIDGYTIDRIGPSTATFTPSGILTSFNDNTIPVEGWYRYEVIPYNSSGDGPTVSTLQFFVGTPEFEQIPFDWIEINTIGTPSGVLDDDDNVQDFDMGISFPFYDCEFFDRINICSNGWLSFTSLSTWLQSLEIPNTNDPNYLIAPYMADLDPSMGGAIYTYYDVVNNRFIVEWDGIPHYNTGGNYTFQALLYGDGTIDFMYHTITHGTVNDEVVGIEDGTGTAGTQVSYNGSGPIVPADSVGVRIYPVCYPEDYCIEMLPEDIARRATPGNWCDYEFMIRNCGDFVDIWDVTATVVAGQPWSFEVWDYAMTTQIDSIGPLESFGSVNFIVRQHVPSNATYEQTSSIEIVVNSQQGIDHNVLADTSYITTTCVLQTTLPYYEDFNTTNGDYVSGGSGCWEWGDPSDVGPDTSCSEPKCWGTEIDTDYPDSACCYLDSPPIDLTSDATLTFCQWYSIETSWDGGNVKISTDLGDTWNLLTPMEGYSGTCYMYNCIPGEAAYTGYPNGEYWQAATFDLSNYAGSTGIIRWTFSSDESVRFPGWYIDNVSITAPEGWCTDIEPDSQINVIGVGDSIDYCLTLENCGTNTDVWDVSVLDVPTGWTAQFMDSMGTAVIDSIGPVASGGFVDFLCRVWSSSTADPDTHTITITANSRYGVLENTLADTVRVSALICPIYQLPFIETFDYGGSVPLSWTIVDGGSVTNGPATWHPEMDAAPDDYLMLSDSDLEGSSATQDEELISPTIDCSGDTLVYLRFYHDYTSYLSDVEVAVDISVDSGAWQNIVSYTGTSTFGTTSHNISTWAANQSEVRIRFHYVTAWGYRWFIDDVEVYVPALTYDAATTSIRVTPTTTNINDGIRKTAGTVYDVYTTIENVGSGSGDVTVNASDELGWSSSTIITDMTGGTCQEILLPDPWTSGLAGVINTITVTAVMVNDTVASNDMDRKSVTVSGEDGDTLQVDDGGPIGTAVYWDPILFPGNLVANKFTPSSYPAQINWVSHRILGPGDPFWPWPDTHHDQFSISIWLEDPQNPGYPVEPPIWSERNMYSSEASGSWTMVSPGVPIVIDSGSFWVGYEQLDNCASLGDDGVCGDGSLHFPSRGWERVSGVWRLVTPTLAGDLMIRANLTGVVFSVSDLVIWLIPTDTDMVSVVLDWSAVAGAVEYKIYKSLTNPTSGYVLIDSTAVTQWTEVNAVMDHVKSYYYVTVDHELDSQTSEVQRVIPSNGLAAEDQISQLQISRDRQQKIIYPELNRVTAVENRTQLRQH